MSDREITEACPDNPQRDTPEPTREQIEKCRSYGLHVAVDGDITDRARFLIALCDMALRAARPDAPPAKAVSGDAAADADRARLDWLDTHCVEVRKPLRYGTRAVFYATVGEDDETCGIRALIDAAVSQDSPDV